MIQPDDNMLPFSIIISNKQDIGVKDFDIFGAYKYQSSAGFDSEGSLLLNGVVISSAMPTMSYKQLLEKTTLIEPKISSIRNSCFFSAGYRSAINQIYFMCCLISIDINGTEKNIDLLPIIDPYGEPLHYAFSEMIFRETPLDGFTRLRISEILPNTVMMLSFK